VGRSEAENINVGGTENLLRFAATCPRIERIGVLSTTYVAGRLRGRIAERPLERHAGFVNEYERSKYFMERRARRFPDLPIALYRLSTILGRESGEVVRWGAVHNALRLFFHGWIPMVPGERGSTVDLISFDYATAALEELFLHRFELGTTTHIAAGVAASLPLREFLDMTARVFRDEDPAWSRRGIELPPVVPLRTFRRLESTVEQTGDVFLSSVMKVMSRFVPQLAYAKTFETRRLSALGLRPEPLDRWFPAVVRFCIQSGWGRRAAGAAFREAV
jgi:nucleoside-diphosphate-sugar epimerase